ncbi:MAG: hypothetical protein ABEJ81_09015 [Haloferacaceae archaeon]
METWRALFDRAVGYGATEGDVRAALAARRDADGGDERGGDA